ncbi:MAG: CRTAC1 family protein [Thermoanaerobaculia bacterium]
MGLAFEHRSGASGELYFVEMMGPGGALLDYDGDGDLDVFLPQGHALGPGAEPRLPEDRDRLFENLLIDHGRPTGQLRFRDVSAAAGLAANGYGGAVATGDVDNDGFPDLYLAQWGADELLHNRGDGTFEALGARTGLADPGWGTAASFFDADGDGKLDLAVANYVDFRYANHHRCFAPSSAPDYCGPAAYPAEPDRLYRNLGGLRFQPLPFDRGVAPRPGLGLAAADFDGDGHADLYVANDQTENNLWLGAGDGSFREGAVLAGLAVNREGAVEASMGLAVADYDGDGDEDILVTNLNGETNTLYQNQGGGLFEDVTPASGLGPPSLPSTGFGTDWLDVDGDGRLDLFVANGDVKLLWNLVTPQEPYPLRQKNQLYRAEDGGRFREVSAQAGPGLEPVETSRGVAVGDVDNDGDPDVLVVNNGGPVRLLLNEGPARRWLGLAVLDGPFGSRRAYRDALGARVVVSLSSGRKQTFRVHTDGSYASARDPRLLLALQPGERALEARVRYADGGQEVFRSLEEGRYQALRRGEGSRP